MYNVKVVRQPADIKYRTKTIGRAPQYENAVMLATGRSSLIHFYALNNSAATVYLAVWDQSVANPSTVSGATVACDQNGVLLGNATATVTVPGGIPPEFKKIGKWVTVSGASSSFFNGTFQITAFDNTHFSYLVGAQPITSNTGISAVAEPDLTIYPIAANSFLDVHMQHDGDSFDFGIFAKAYTDAALTTPAGSVMLFKADSTRGY